MKFFFLIFFILYGLLNFYIILRTSQSLQLYPNLRVPIISTIIFCALSFILHNILEAKLSFEINSILYSIGSIWMIAALYFFMSILFLDLIRLLNHFLHFLPNIITQNYIQSKFIILCSITGIVGVVFIAGYINFKNPNVVNLDITIPDSHQNKELTIVAASDLHLGYSVKKAQLQEYIKLINIHNPDLILLLGDIVDRTMQPVIQQNMKEDLMQLHAKYGVYAIEGNHETMGDLQKSGEYIEAAGITELRDTAIEINNELFLIGRMDRSNKNRKSLDDLVKNLDNSKPKILMDHQPFNLEEAENTGIDLQLSGHTHAGQIFPNNLIVKKIYEIAHGYLKKGNTQYYVSSGLGLWGAPLRIGSQSELLVIKLIY